LAIPCGARAIQKFFPAIPASETTIPGKTAFAGVPVECAHLVAERNEIPSDFGGPDDRPLHREHVSENAFDLTALRIDVSCLSGTSSQFEMRYLNLP